MPKSRLFMSCLPRDSQHTELLTHCNTWVDSARAPGRYGARRCGDRREQTGHHDEDDGICDRNTEQLALERALQSKDADGAKAEADSRDNQALPHHQGEHRAGARSKCESDSDLLSALCDDVHEYPVDA